MTRRPARAMVTPRLATSGGLALRRHRAGDEHRLDRLAQPDQPQAGAQSPEGLGGARTSDRRGRPAVDRCAHERSGELRDDLEAVAVAGDVFGGLDLVVEELGEEREPEAEDEPEREAEQGVAGRVWA